MLRLNSNMISTDCITYFRIKISMPAKKALLSTMQSHLIYCQQIFQKVTSISSYFYPQWCIYIILMMLFLLLMQICPLNLNKIKTQIWIPKNSMLSRRKIQKKLEKRMIRVEKKSKIMIKIEVDIYILIKIYMSFREQKTK